MSAPTLEDTTCVCGHQRTAHSTTGDECFEDVFAETYRQCGCPFFESLSNAGERQWEHRNREAGYGI